MAAVLPLLWTILSYNDFMLPLAVYHGLSDLVGSLSAS